MSASRSFCRFLVRRGILSRNPVEDIPSERENAFAPFVFSRRHTEGLLRSVEKAIRKEEKQFLRDLSAYTAILPVARCGLRISEPPRLAAKNRDREEDSLYIEIGLGYWTHQLQTAFAWYPRENRATTAALAVTGEAHGNKEDVDIRPGARISLNWGISQSLPLKSDKTLLMEIGLSGYDQWQVNDDSGSDAQNADVHDRIHAAGVQLGIAHVPWNAFVAGHYLHEFGERDRFEGQVATISFGKKF